MSRARAKETVKATRGQGDTGTRKHPETHYREARKWHRRTTATFKEADRDGMEIRYGMNNILKGREF